MRDLEQEEGKTPSRPLTPKQKDILDLINERKNSREVASALGITYQLVRNQMKFIEKKGYEFQPVKDGAKILYYEVCEV